MVMDAKKEAFISMAKAALRRAQQETDELPLSIPSPLRDNFFSALMNALTQDDSHRTDHCEGCRGYALDMALSALGWKDQTARRPTSPKERMDALTEQVVIALRFLDKLHREGLPEEEEK